MMHLYCIKFMRQTEDNNTEHNFFIYDKTKVSARKRFCVVTGYKSSCIVSVSIINE